MNSNWCEVCQEACHEHPTICSICGTTLTAAPSDATTNSNMNSNHDGFTSTNEQLLLDMRQASRELRNILGNLRGQVQDLDVLTRNILDEQENGDDNLDGVPQEVWDPQHGSSGPVSRPTSKDALNKIPRFVLNNRSTLFRQATIRVNTDLNASGVSSTAPVVFEDGNNDSRRQLTMTEDVGRSSSDISSTKNVRNVDCTLGEFGSAKEYMFEMGTSLVLASPVTGKGGLDKETKARISQLKAHANNVVLFMQRGDGLTFVQKARMAQEAGVAAVIIGNNASNPWPYVMKDSRGESTKPGLSVLIPVAMIKEADSHEMVKMLEKKKEIALQRQRKKRSQPPIPKQIILGNEKRPHALQQLQLQTTFSQQEDAYDNCNHHEFSLSCELKITAQSCDCPVCCEQLQNSETVIQLSGCGHIFHESCALVWLKSHNTCPYCRRELPTDDLAYERERRRRQQQEQEQQTNAGNTESGNMNGGSFYR